MEEKQGRTPTYLDIAKTAINGDEPSVQIISDWLIDRVSKICASLPTQVQEDIAKEVIMKFLTGLEDFDPLLGKGNPIENFHRWSSIIIRNTKTDYLRDIFQRN